LYVPLGQSSQSAERPVLAEARWIEQTVQLLSETWPG
jgi:hypothetical protein